MPEGGATTTGPWANRRRAMGPGTVGRAPAAPGGGVSRGTGRRRRPGATDHPALAGARHPGGERPIAPWRRSSVWARRLRRRCRALRGGPDEGSPAGPGRAGATAGGPRPPRRGCRSSRGDRGEAPPAGPGELLTGERDRTSEPPRRWRAPWVVSCRSGTLHGLLTWSGSCGSPPHGRGPRCSRTASAPECPRLGQRGGSPGRGGRRDRERRMAGHHRVPAAWSCRRSRTGRRGPSDRGWAPGRSDGTRP